ncbi:MAG: hypothetical protein PHY69_07660, partial [Dysgonamonadaceae bacterium]|nr:hypothetical protein [Dysgonamonadaceae bacterium]
SCILNVNYNSQQPTMLVAHWKVAHTYPDSLSPEQQSIIIAKGLLLFSTKDLNLFEHHDLKIRINYLHLHH